MPVTGELFHTMFFYSLFFFEFIAVTLSLLNEVNVNTDLFEKALCG